VLIIINYDARRAVVYVSPSLVNTTIYPYTPSPAHTLREKLIFIDKCTIKNNAKFFLYHLVEI
jgi:hypothetical protein